MVLGNSSGDGSPDLFELRRTTRAPWIDEVQEVRPLTDDLRAYLGFVGREFFLPAEPIGGGPWSTVARVLRETAVELKVASSLNPRILRRSYARRMFELTSLQNLLSGSDAL